MRKTNEIEKVTLLLKEQNLTRRALAKRVGIEEANLNMWFSKRCSIPKEWIRPVAVALGVSADFLLEI